MGVVIKESWPKTGWGNSKLTTPFSSVADINIRAQRSSPSAWKCLRQGGVVPRAGTLGEAESTTNPILAGQEALHLLGMPAGRDGGVGAGGEGGHAGQPRQRQHQPRLAGFLFYDICK